MVSIRVYVKDDNQLSQLRTKYPDVDADYINMDGQKDPLGLLPRVCVTENGKETCDTGEQLLRKFSKRLDYFQKD